MRPTDQNQVEIYFKWYKICRICIFLLLNIPFLMNIVALFSETFLTYYHLYIFNRKPDNSVAMSTGALQLHVQKQLV